MGKRSNESAQISKEEYDAMQDSGGDSQIQMGVQRASKETLKKRRIISVSKTTKWKSITSTQTTPGSSGINPSAGVSNLSNSNAGASNSSSNPFAGVSNLSTANTQASNSSSNPFAGIGNLSNVKEASNSKINPFAGMGNLSNVNATAPKTMFAAKPTTAGVTTTNPVENSSQNISKTIQFLKNLQEQAKSIPTMSSDWSADIEEFKTQIRNSSKPAPAPAPVQAPAPAPFPGFSFTQPSSNQQTEKPPKPFASFSFATNTSKPSSTTAAPITDSNKTISTTAEKDDSKNIFSKENTPEKKADADEDIVHSVRAKKYQLNDNEWKDLGIGFIRLMKHKTQSSRKRIVMRNEAGKVMLNISIGKGMKFDKVLQKRNAFVRFVARESEDSNAEKFMIKVSVNDVDEFHSTLQEMAE